MATKMKMQFLDLLARHNALRTTIAADVGADKLAEWETTASALKVEPEPPAEISSSLVEVDDLSDLAEMEDGEAKDEAVAARTRLSWFVRLTVSGTWVAEGFDLTDERAMEMLRKDLDFAYEHELGVKVLAAPPPKAIRTLQGARKEELAELEAEVQADDDDELETREILARILDLPNTPDPLEVSTSALAAEVEELFEAESPRGRAATKAASAQLTDQRKNRPASGALDDDL